MGGGIELFPCPCGQFGLVEREAMARQKMSAELSAAQIIFRSPRNLAAAAFLYLALSLLRVRLTLMIRINAATFCDSAFHWHASRLLLQSRVLLNLKGYH